MSAWLIWLLLGMVLAGAELMTGDMSLLMLGGAALATSATTALVDLPLWAQGAVFLVVAVLLLAGLRPTLRRRMNPGVGLLDPAKALEGEHALVLQQVDQYRGQIKLDGDVWTARPFADGDVYLPGERVTVMHIDGATAVVWKSPDD